MVQTRVKRKSFAAAVFLAITGGLFIAIPRYLFPTCGFSQALSSGSGRMMHCDTAGTIAVFLGVATLASVVVLIRVSGGSARVGALGVALVAALALVPLFLFWPGVCKAATMPCRIGTLPAVLLVGGVQTVVAIAALVAELRHRGEGERE